MIIVFNTSVVSPVLVQEFTNETVSVKSDSIRIAYQKRAVQLKKRILERQAAIQEGLKVDDKSENAVNDNDKDDIAKDVLKGMVFLGENVRIKGKSNQDIKSNGGDHTIIVSQTGRNNTVSINQNNQIQPENKDENER